MSVFDTYADTPFKIKEEGEEIVVRVHRTGPTTLRVSWNLPNVLQCGQDSAYNGALVTIATSPTVPTQLPVDGTEYTADPTASPTLNAGDSIGTALVIGAFYNDRHTTFFDVTDAPSTTAFYVSLHAVDAQYRYYTAGVQSYSLPYGNNNPQVSYPGHQVVVLGTTGSGVTLTQPTRLTPGVSYGFELACDLKHHPSYIFQVTGTVNQTYDDLLTSLNNSVIAATNPQYGTALPGTNYYWYNAANQDVEFWNGTVNVGQDAIILGSDPINANNNQYWYDSANTQLFQFTGGAYSQVQYFNLGHDPRQPFLGDYWLNPNTSQLYCWNGTVWGTQQMYTQTVDPQLATPAGLYWFDGTTLWMRNEQYCTWGMVSFVSYSADITQPTTGEFWLNTTQQALYQWSGTAWTLQPAFSTKPTVPATGAFYIDAVNETVEVYTTGGWIPQPALATAFDPTTPPDGTIWVGSNGFQMWDVTTSSWVSMQVTTSGIDPTTPPVLTQGVVWYDNAAGVFSKLVGTSWVPVTGQTIQSVTKPQSLTNFVWFNPRAQQFSQCTNGMLSNFNPIWIDFAPASIVVGQLWYSPTSATLSQWNGTGWTVIPSATTPFSFTTGGYFYNTATSVLYQWNGKTFVQVQPNVIFSLDENGNVKITSSTMGSKSWVKIIEGPPNPYETASAQGFAANTLWTSSALALPRVHLEHPRRGVDPISQVPSYMELGVGTDGSQDERRELARQIKSLLGYPVVEVELTKEMLDDCIDNALKELRYKSGSGYKRCMFFMDIEPHLQKYILSDAAVGFNKIVEVLYLHRMTSAYLGTGVGAGVYGQIAIQQLYTYGKFDLVSYHLVAGYIELMKQLFATEIQFQWDEYKRELSIYKDFWIHERVLVDAVIEKTEQEILTDRWTAKWVQKYALAQARLQLAEVRGKYTSVVAAGGSTSLNAAELRAAAEREMQECQDEIDNYIVSNKEDWGAASDFLIG